jgi:hypothetical protein
MPVPMREPGRNIRANNDPRLGGGAGRPGPGGGGGGGGLAGSAAGYGGGRPIAGGRFTGGRVGPPVMTAPAPVYREPRGGPPQEDVSSYPGQDTAPFEGGGPPPWSNAGGNGNGQGRARDPEAGPSSFPNFGQGRGFGGGGGGGGRNFAPAPVFRGLGGTQGRFGGAIPMRLPLGRGGARGRRRAGRGIPMRKT